MKKRSSKYPCIIHSHASTWHDGGVALLLTDGSMCALAAERVGDRYKHSWNSKLAYDYLKGHFKDTNVCTFGTSTDHFKDPAEGLEKNNHHLYHAASAFFGSGFNEAAILVIDGQGPEEEKLISVSIWDGDKHKLTLVETPYLTKGKFAASSLGHFYTAIGAFAGMCELYEEGKTMGLAAYGASSDFVECFRQYAHSNSDGSYFIDPTFNYAVLGNTLGPKFFGWPPQPSGIQKVWDKLLKLRQTPLRQPGQDVTQDDMNIAYAGQLILDEIMLGLARRAKNLTGKNFLCLAGGVALNAIANGKILKSGLFKDVYIFPAAGDDGQALGKLFYDIHSSGIDINTKTSTAFYGPVYSQDSIRSVISLYRSRTSIVASGFDRIMIEAADRIAQGQVIGWYQGGSEIGPRALGHRSILADSRKADMRDYINLKVKGREWYRPLAPIVLEENAGDFFDVDRPSPYMLIITDVKTEQKSSIPAVIHADGTARVQTVNENQDHRIYDLIYQFSKKTGIPLLLNTSFNRRNEPLVETAEDAIKAFIDLNLDALVLGDHLLIKK